jgi:hypothetical protein
MGGTGQRARPGQDRGIEFQVDSTFIHVIEDSHRADGQVAGHDFSRHLIKVEFLGELLIKDSQDLPDRRLSLEELPAELIVTDELTWAFGLLIMQGEFAEVFKALTHPRPVHGRTVVGPARPGRAKAESACWRLHADDEQPSW